MDIKILIADDDIALRKLLFDILKKNGYTPILAEDGAMALDLFFQKNDIDLVILDVMMPKYSGFEVLNEIRNFSDVPVLMLTALSDEINEINGFKSGADEYITKPFSYDIFLARVEALLKNVKKERTAIALYGDIKINRQKREVYVRDEYINLNNKEYELLDLLLKNKGKILSRENILNVVWGYDYDGEIRTIDTHIKMLRAKLFDCSRYIKTSKGVGYIFDVEEEVYNE